MLLQDGIKIFSFFIIFMFTQRQELCKTIVVGNNEENIKTIKAAVKLAQDGDSIHIHNSIYREGNITINKELTILGIDWPVIDGENKYENITVTSNNVIISGLKLVNSGISFIEDNAAVKLKKVKYCTISNNKACSTPVLRARENT